MLGVMVGGLVGLGFVGFFVCFGVPGVGVFAVACFVDAIKTIELVSDYLKQAVEAGKAKRAKAAPDKDETEETKK
jgi:hypothetical protein